MSVLKALFITAAGDVGPGKGYEQLRKWVEANGGRWSPRVVKGVTHLICSKDAYKKKVEAVQQAMQLGALIVSYDWLEDSLQRRRKLAESKYTWEVLRRQRKNRKALKRLAPEADTKKFLDGCKKAREDIGSGMSRVSSSQPKGSFFRSALSDLSQRRKAREQGPQSTAESPAPSPPAVPKPPRAEKLTDLYHTYLDATGFNYDLILLRQNPLLNTFAKYDLRLYESHTKPHVYCVFIRYTPPGATRTPSASSIPATTTHSHPQAARLHTLITPPVPHPSAPYKTLLCPPGTSFSEAFATFRTAFRDLTLLTWEQRLDNPRTDPSSLQRLRARALRIEPFVWANRPAAGMPVGAFPALPLEGEAPYKRNQWEPPLPALEEGLGVGVVGREVLKEEEGRRREAEEGERKEGKGEGMRRKSVVWRGPLFNAADGTVSRGAWEQGVKQKTKIKSERKMRNGGWYEE